MPRSAPARPRPAFRLPSASFAAACHPFAGLLSAGLLAFAMGPARAATDVAGQLMPPAGQTGFVEVGGEHQLLDHGYGDWSGAYLRGVWTAPSKDVVTFELVDSRRFGEHGAYAALGATHDFDDRWYGSATLGGGDGAFYWPDWRIDVALSRKWGASRSVVTTLGYTQYNAPDGHVDRTGLLGFAWYAPHHLVLEGGWRPNRSSPGGVRSDAGFAALTWGEDGRQYLSLRHDRGREAYQTIGEDVLLVDFPSHVTALTWRRWVTARCGFNLRYEAYASSNYDRHGGEAGVFCGY
ncbi:MAG TPA: YaiO family outer membrane beta-barrel protein [Xanthomonadaceae bacterium]|nr:YaiO family outer membrane beta-barrel protein [Xanthomonadaceae bacterium]